MGFGVNVRSVSECSLLEENRVPVALRENAVALEFRAFEIKTLYCEL